MKLVTGTDILERIRRDLKTPANVGRYSDENLRRFFQEEWDLNWEDLSAGDYGIGQGTTEIAGTGQLHTMPADMLYMLAVALDIGDGFRIGGQYTSDKQLNSENWFTTFVHPDHRTWRFQLFTNSLDELSVYPDLQSGGIIFLTYATQPFNLGDPTNPIWNFASINVISESVYRHTIAGARVRAVSRQDRQEYQRAQEATLIARDKFLATRRTRQQAAGNGAQRYASLQNRWLGYS